MNANTSCNTAEKQGFWQLNGKWQAQLPIQDRGLAYGDGLFETCLLMVRDGVASIPCWAYHRARLLLGCQRLGLPLTEETLEADWQLFLQTISADINSNILANSIIKLIVTRGQGGRGYAPPSEPSLNMLWQLLPAPKANSEVQGVHVEQSAIQLANQPVLAGLKHLNRLEYVLAAKHCNNGIALLLDVDDYVVETLSHNIFCVIDGQLITPVLDGCGVKGVLRALIEQQLAPQLGLVFGERKLTLSNLASASEVFVGNSVRGVWPVTSALLLKATHLTWPVGPVSCKLQQSWLHYISSY